MVFRARRAGLWAACCLLLGCLLPGPGAPLAADKQKITAVEPASVNQGDTLLLTIRGEHLPTGAVVIEFYPQQVAVLSILSADEHEIMAQIKVPPLAPPGKYNIIVYNQLGEEASGDQLFTVLTDLVTPVFKDYDPKVIAQAGAGFALILSGEMISREAVDHLSMEWTQNKQPVEGLETSFAYSNAKSVTCAVSGSLPGGKLDGRILLDGKPIYFLSIQLPGVRPEVLGHGPSELAGSSNVYTLRLVGTGFSASMLARLTARLVQVPPKRKIKPLEMNGAIKLLDDSALELSFSGMAPPGAYTLYVQLDGAPLYSGNVTVLEEEEAPAEPQDNGRSPEHTAPPENDSADQPPAEPGGPEEGSDPVEGDNSSVDLGPPEDGGSAADSQPGGRLPVLSVKPLLIDAGSPVRFSIALGTVSYSLKQRLTAELDGTGFSAEQIMLGTKDNALIAVFDLPLREYHKGDELTLTISDPQQEVEDYRVSLRVAADWKPAGGEAATPESVLSGPLPHSNAPAHELKDTSGDVAEGANNSSNDSTGEDDAEDRAETDAGTEEEGGAVDVATALPAADEGKSAGSAEDKTSEKAEQEAQSGAEIAFKNGEALLDDKGFSIVVASPQELALELFEGATWHSDNPLLEANADKFELRASAESGKALVLRFDLKEGALDPLAWQLLSDSLLSAGEVSLQLLLGDSEQEFDGSVVFRPAK